jgi:hypothetical protein
VLLVEKENFLKRPFLFSLTLLNLCRARLLGKLMISIIFIIILLICVPVGARGDEMK